MSEKIRYTNEPLGDLEVVTDFLPYPEDLVFRDEGVKVTIALSKRSVEFFKNEALKHNTQYQRMIRRQCRRPDQASKDGGQSAVLR